MGKRTGKPMGRPPKPEAEKALRKTYSIAPELWAEVERYIPPGERSEVIQAALRREVEIREAAKESENRA